MRSARGIFPDRMLRSPVEHREHPVMARQIGKIPRHGSIRLAQRVGAVDQRDIIQLRPADALGLQTRNRPVSWRSRSVSGGRPTQLFSLSGALAQLGDERSGRGRP